MQVNAHCQLASNMQQCSQLLQLACMARLASIQQNRQLMLLATSHQSCKTNFYMPQYTQELHTAHTTSVSTRGLCPACPGLTGSNKARKHKCR
jgi:hypothetical protein